MRDGRGLPASLLDGLDVPAHGRVHVAPGKDQLRVAEDRREQIVEVVRPPTG